MVLGGIKKRQRIDDDRPEWLRGAVVPIEDLLAEGLGDCSGLILRLFISALVARPLAWKSLRTGNMVRNNLLRREDFPKVVNGELFASLITSSTTGPAHHEVRERD